MTAVGRRTKHKLAAIALLLCVILLSACSGETNLTLYPEERWLVTSTFSFDRGLLPELTVGLEVCRLIGLNIGLGTRGWGLAALESGLDEMVAQYRGQGVDASWTKSGLPWGTVRYTVTARGDGWDKLQKITPPVFELRVSQTEQGAFNVTVRSTTMETGLGALVPFTFRLHGGQIVSSNADVASGGTATWSRPTGPIEAVVTPAPEQNMLVPLLVGSGALVGAGAIGAGVYLYHRRRVKPRRTRPSQRPRRPSTWQRRPTQRS